jgi:hypothetical protein
MHHPNALGDPASGTFIGENSALLLQKAMTLAEPITLAGRMDFANGSNVMAAPLTIAGPNVLLCATSIRTEFNGPIDGVGKVQFCGIGTNAYNGGGNFAGIFDIFAGRHIITGQYPGTEFRIEGNSFFSTTVEGTGRVGRIHAYDQETNSIIAPGINGPGVLTCGGLVVESNITLRIELNGTAPGSGHDQLVVDGPIALTYCTLELSFGFTPAPGDSFVIVNHTGAGPVAGTFDGLPQGALITNGATVLQILYTGGDGNDIVLRPPGPIPTTISSIHYLPDGTKQLEILGQPNVTYVIEATADLLSPPALIPWVPISTNIADGSGLFLYFDTGSTNNPRRFYRVTEP